MDSENLITLIKNNIKITNSMAVKYGTGAINYQDENGDSILHWVIRKNQIDNFTNLLKNIFLNLNIINKKGHTLLIEAVKNNNYKFIDLLLNNKKFKFINYQDDDKKSALDHALELETETIALRLLDDKNLYLNLVNYKNYTALCYSAYQKKYLVVKKIIKQCKNATINNNEKNISDTIYFLLINKNWQLLLNLIEIIPNNTLDFYHDLAILKKIINEKQWNIAEKLIEKIKSSLFIFNSSNECYEMLNWLIVKKQWKLLKIWMEKLELKILNRFDQYLIFFQFSENDKWELVTILLKKINLKLLEEDQIINILLCIIHHKKWINCEEILENVAPMSLGVSDSNGGASLLHFSLCCGQWKLALKLIDKLSPNCFTIKDNFYHYPILFLAILYKNEKIVIKILNRLSDDLLFSNFDEQYQSLYLAIKFKLFEASKIMINRLPCSILNNIFEVTDWTPLHLAIENHNSNIALQLINKLSVEKLLQSDMEFKATPLHLAVQENMIEVINLLIEKISPEGLLVADKRGFIPFHIAVINNQFETAKQILNKMPLEKLICKNDNWIETPLVTIMNYCNKDLFNILFERVIINAWDDEKDLNKGYLKILKNNLTYLKEMSILLHFSIEELTMASIEGEQIDKNECWVAIKYIGDGKDDNFEPKISENSSDLTKKSHLLLTTNNTTVKTTFRFINFKTKKRQNLNKNIENKKYKKVDPVKKQANKINFENKKPMCKSQMKIEQKNYQQIEKSLLDMQKSEIKAKMHEKQLFEKHQKKVIENVESQEDVLLATNNYQFSNVESTKIINEVSKSLSEKKKIASLEIKDEIVKICRKTNVDGIGRPAIFIGKIKNDNNEILVLFGTKKDKQYDNVKKILSLKINNTNLEQNTYFYDTNFRIINRNELVGLWDTNRILSFDEKYTISTFFSEAHLQKLI